MDSDACGAVGSGVTKEAAPQSEDVFRIVPLVSLMQRYTVQCVVHLSRQLSQIARCCFAHNRSEAFF